MLKHEQTPVTMFVDNFSVSASALAKMQHPVKGSHVVTGDIGGQVPYETIGDGLEELLVATGCQETTQVEELEDSTETQADDGGEQMKKQIEKEARKQTKHWNKKLKKLVGKVFNNL